MQRHTKYVAETSQPIEPGLMTAQCMMNLQIVSKRKVARVLKPRVADQSAFRTRIVAIMPHMHQLLRSLQRSACCGCASTTSAYSYNILPWTVQEIASNVRCRLGAYLARPCRRGHRRFDHILEYHGLLQEENPRSMRRVSRRCDKIPFSASKCAGTRSPVQQKWYASRAYASS